MNDSVAESWQIKKKNTHRRSQSTISVQREYYPHLHDPVKNLIYFSAKLADNEYKIPVGSVDTLNEKEYDPYEHRNVEHPNT